MSGLFITFEGGEGGGKTTQIQRLHHYLQSQHQDVIVSREPGGTPVGDRIRELLLDPENKKITATTELLLYEAARAQHVDELINPALRSGTWVLCDRFCDSTIAYQGAGRNLSGDIVEDINGFATSGLVPDITFLLDLAPDIGLGRATLRGLADRIEKESLDFHTRVREGFLALALANPDRIHIIDALQPVDDIAEQIQGIIKSVLNERGV